MSRTTWVAIGAISLGLLAQAAQVQTGGTAESETGAHAAPVEGASGIDLSAIDKTADPCNDFFQYACGNWMKAHPVPANESVWSEFNELYQRNQTKLRDILEDSAAHENRSETDQKIGAFYHSCMDERGIEARGTAPLKPELDRIDAIKSREELPDEIGRLQDMGIPVFFLYDTTPDPKNARMDIAEVDQGGLGLPEKDFYFRDDEKSQEIRRKYVVHVAKTFELIGVPREEAAKKAATVMSFETALAKASLDITARRDPQLLLHEMSKADLEKLAPDLHFGRIFAQMGIPEFQILNVEVPDYFKAANAELLQRPIGDVRDYLTWRYVASSSDRLTKAFVDENFDFYTHTLNGVREIKPRWRRCVTATDLQLGEALGQKFAEQTFGKEGKERTLAMVREIEHEMAKDIEALTWMSPETKRQALVKLQGVTNKIGYPDKWRDYSAVRIVNDDYFGNWYRAAEFEAKRQHEKVGKPVDRGEFGMTVPTVNAYYDPSENNINFPAGILQPPFYSNHADDAVIHGSVGIIIGHELTHGFDDQGRQFDSDGNLRDWWTKSDAEQFEKLADCFVKEYSGFSPVEGVQVNGKLTLGENTADNGGSRLAYAALMADLAKKGIPPSAKQDGYTQPQQFFLGYAQIWCENVRPEQARTWAQTDPHSPGRFRADGVVSNTPEFSRAFGCKAGDKMYAAEGKGCRVW